MRESEKNELIERLDVIDETVCGAKYWVQRADDPSGIQEAMFRFGAASAYITRLREDIRDTEADPDEDDYPELPPNGTMSGLFAGTAGWKAAQEPSEYVSAAVAAEQKAEETEDVILPKEEQAVSTGARIKVSNLPEVNTLPPTKEVRVPDEELPKPRRRGGRPKKKFTPDEESPDPFE